MVLVVAFSGVGRYSAEGTTLPHSSDVESKHPDATAVGVFPPDTIHTAETMGSDDADAPGGVFFGVGGGLALGTLSVGGASGNNASGPVYALSIGTTRGAFRRWILDFELHPFDVPSPVLDEAYRSWNVLLGLSLGSRAFVVPRIGIQGRSWSGPERPEDSDVGLAFGLSAGVQKEFAGGWIVAPEAFWLTSGVELEGSVSSSALGVKISVVRVFRGS